MKHFMSNPCGYDHCMSIDCHKCRHFKPRYRGIPVPRWLGWLLYEHEEYINIKRWAKEHPEEENGRGEF